MTMVSKPVHRFTQFDHRMSKSGLYNIRKTCENQIPPHRKRKQQNTHLLDGLANIGCLVKEVVGRLGIEMPAITAPATPKNTQNNINSLYRPHFLLSLMTSSSPIHRFHKRLPHSSKTSGCIGSPHLKQITLAGRDVVLKFAAEFLDVGLHRPGGRVSEDTDGFPFHVRGDL